MSILGPLGVAADERWKGYAPLVDYMGGPHVFSRTVPPGFAFPAATHRYITIGDTSETGDGAGALGSDGYRATLVAHAWTHGIYDDAPVKEMYRLMHEALVQTPLQLAGFGTVSVKLELAVVVADPDLEKRHANVRWRAFTITQMNQ